MSKETTKTSQIIEKIKKYERAINRAAAADLDYEVEEYGTALESLTADLRAEEKRAGELRAQYEAMDPSGSGEDNAMDTYGSDQRDTPEFWQCAIDSEQFLRNG